MTFCHPPQPGQPPDIAMWHITSDLQCKPRNKLLRRGRDLRTRLSLSGGREGRTQCSEKGHGHWQQRDTPKRTSHAEYTQGEGQWPGCLLRATTLLILTPTQEHASTFGSTTKSDLIPLRVCVRGGKRCRPCSQTVFLTSSRASRIGSRRPAAADLARPRAHWIPLAVVPLFHSRHS